MFIIQSIKLMRLTRKWCLLLIFNIKLSNYIFLFVFSNYISKIFYNHSTIMNSNMESIINNFKYVSTIYIFHLFLNVDKINYVKQPIKK